MPERGVVSGCVRVSGVRVVGDPTTVSRGDRHLLAPASRLAEEIIWAKSHAWTAYVHAAAVIGGTPNPCTPTPTRTSCRSKGSSRKRTASGATPSLPSLTQQATKQARKEKRRRRGIT